MSDGCDNRLILHTFSKLSLAKFLEIAGADLHFGERSVL